MMKKFTRRLSNVFFPVLDENDPTDTRSICSTTSSINDFGYAIESHSSTSSSDFEERSGLSHKLDSFSLAPPVRDSPVSLWSQSILEDELEYDASSSSSSEHEEHDVLFRKLDGFRRSQINELYDEIVDQKLNSDDKNNSQLQGIIDRK